MTWYHLPTDCEISCNYASERKVNDLAGLRLAGVQIVDCCLVTRAYNGGLIDLNELRYLLSKRRRASREPISEDDCLRAISKLKVVARKSFFYDRSIVFTETWFLPPGFTGGQCALVWDERRSELAAPNAG